jgi:hypothetical protein
MSWRWRSGLALAFALLLSVPAGATPFDRNTDRRTATDYEKKAARAPRLCRTGANSTTSAGHGPLSRTPKTATGTASANSAKRR